MLMEPNFLGTPKMSMGPRKDIQNDNGVLGVFSGALNKINFDTI